MADLQEVMTGYKWIYPGGLLRWAGGRKHEWTGMDADWKCAEFFRRRAGQFRT